MKSKLALILLALCMLPACGAPTATPTANVPTAASAAATTAPTAITEAPTTAATEPGTAAATEAPTDAATAAATEAATTVTIESTAAATAADASGTSTSVDLKSAPVGTISGTDGGYYHLQSQLGENKRCLEGQGGAAPGSGAVLDGAAFMDTCQNVTGQIWKLVPQKNGYYRLQNRIGEEKNLCLEGNRLAKESLLAGAAVMNTCSDVTGQSWKIVDAGNGSYHLQTKFLEADNKCLEGQGGAAPGSGAVLDGAAFMDDCKNVSGQFWTFTPIDVGMNTVPDAATAEAPTAAAAEAPTTAAVAEAPTATPAAATIKCDAQYAAEIPKFKDAVVAEFEQERTEATQKDGIARPSLVWNDQLACQAQEWAQAIATDTYRSNPHCCYAPIPIHSNPSSWTLGAPEGIAGGKTAVEAMQLWRATEMQNFDFSASEAAKRKDHTCLRQVCGHYGAVIGLFTTEVGCGFYALQAGKEQNYNFVCQYVFKQSR